MRTQSSMESGLAVYKGSSRGALRSEDGRANAMLQAIHRFISQLKNTHKHTQRERTSVMQRFPSDNKVKLPEAGTLPNMQYLRKVSCFMKKTPKTQ